MGQMTRNLAPIVLLAAVAAGCGGFERTTYPVTDVKAVATASPPSTMWNAATPEPTISRSQEASLAGILQDAGCQLPCYLGITPGKTSASDAEETLSRLGAFRVGSFEDGDLDAEEYRAWIGDQALPRVTAEPYSPPGNLGIAQTIILTRNDDVIERVTTDVSSTSLPDKYRDYWSLYSPDRVLDLLGLPDMVVGRASTSSFGLMLVFQDRGVVVEVYGPVHDGKACPNLPDDQVHLRLISTNPESGLSIFSPLWPSSADERYWAPVEEVFGIEASGAYVRLLEGPKGCLEVVHTFP